MATLISNTGRFDLQAGVEDAKQFVADEADRCAQNVRDFDPSKYELVVSVELELKNRKRVGSLSGQEIYNAEVARVNAPVWIDEQNKAVFRFDDEVFVWKGRQIYLAVGEKLAMFRILVLKEYPAPGMLGSVRATVRRLRARFGNDFPGVPHK